MRTKDKIGLPRIHDAERLFALDHPSLGNLAYILRHRELWPKGFKWNYNHCEMCAMGLASRLWHAHILTPMVSVTMRAFAISPKDAWAIFLAADGVNSNPMRYYGVSEMEHVTPEMVADKIDEYLR